MKKIIASLAMFGTMVLPAAGVLAAGNIDNVIFEDPATGVTQPNVKCDRNEVVQAHMQVTLTGTTDLESMSYDNHDGLGRHRFDILEDQIIPGTWSADFDYACPSHGGTQSPTFWAHGVPGDVSTDNFATNGTAFDSIVATNAVTVSNVVSTTGPSVPSSTPTPTPMPVGNAWDSVVSSLTAQIKALQDSIASFLHPTTPTKPAYCAGLSAKVAGATYGMYTAGNTALQHYLMDNGFSIPALSAGAMFGFDGPQTQAAVSAAQSACL